jgi:CheY-like chemotaxis protein
VPEPPSSRARLLIVDDDARFRALLAELLSADGRFEVVGEAETGEQAVALAAERHPDIVTMDLDMPGMGGVAATRIIAWELGIPVVALSGSGPEDEALEAGASAALVKTDIAAIAPALLAAAAVR